MTHTTWFHGYIKVTGWDWTKAKTFYDILYWYPTSIRAWTTSTSKPQGGGRSHYYGPSKAFVLSNMI